MRRRPDDGRGSSRRRKTLIGIDTNVVVRWLTDARSDPKQAEKAAAIFSREQLHLSIAATVEAIWVLESVYRVRRDEIATVLRTLLSTTNLTVQGKIQLEQALDDHTLYRGDLTDHIIAALDAETGCEYTLTFDKKAARSKRFRLV